MFLTGRRRNLQSESNVNEEYMQAFRTKSFTDILAKVHGDNGRSLSKEEQTSSPIHLSQIHEQFLEPQQEKLLNMVGNSNPHELLLEYFKGSLEAFKLCSSLLDRINQARTDYKIIQRALKLGQMMTMGDNYSSFKCRCILDELAGFAGINNPLAGPSRVQFGQVQELYRIMLKDLISKRMKARRRAKLIRFCKKASGVIFVLIIGALFITSIVVVVYTSIGIAAMPVILCSSSGFLHKRRITPEKGYRERPLVRLAAQLDAAARGTYIVDQDFDTMSRLVTRLHDEIEHMKAVIGLCLRSQKEGLLQEALKELKSEEACFLEQLEELEAHIYLCFLTINRARKLVLQELQKHQ